MYITPEDARSDVILAAAAAVFGPILVTLVYQAPGVPGAGIPRFALDTALVFAITGLVPLLLARYRDDVPGAFALHRDQDGLLVAASLVIPIAALGVLHQLALTGELVPAVLGRVGQVALASPVIEEPGRLDVLGGLLQVVMIVVVTVGGLLLLAFVTVRGRDAFRSDERSATELVRTLGVGAAGIGLVLGLARSLGDGSPLLAVLNPLVLVAVVLLADRHIPARATVGRWAVLTPAILVAALHVLGSGGLFGDLPLGLQTGALAGGVTVVMAVMIEHRRSAVVVIPLLVALTWWPTCLHPVPFMTPAC